MMTMLDLLPRFDLSLRPHLNFLDRFFDDWRTPTLYNKECEWLPPSDITDTDTAYHVAIELPGIDIKGLDISYTEGILTVKGEKSKDVSIDESCSCTERYFGSFERSFRIPGKVDADHIEANYNDGILKISLTKSGESAVRKIEVH